MSGFFGPVQNRSFTYALLVVTAVATLIALVQPRPLDVPETARPVMLAE